jgi:membrane protein DedA with SNARE-associated domain
MNSTLAISAFADEFTTLREIHDTISEMAVWVMLVVRRSLCLRRFHLFTNLVTQILTLLGNVPPPVVYLILALWIGVDCAGIPVPMEPVLLFTGALAAQGRISLALALVSATFGALLFASLAYTIGRRIRGETLVRAGHYVGFTQARADHLDLWLRRRGLLGVIVASVCPMLRTFSGYLMGMAQVARSAFILGVIIGAGCYSAFWLALGTELGEEYREPLHLLDQLGIAGALVLVAGVVVIIVLHHLWGRMALSRVAAHYHRHHHTHHRQESQDESPPDQRVRVQVDQAYNQSVQEPARQQPREQ